MTEKKKRPTWRKALLGFTPGILSAIIFLVGIAVLFIWTEKAFESRSQAILFTGAIGAPGLFLLIRALLYNRFAAWLGNEYGIAEDMDLE